MPRTLRLGDAGAEVRALQDVLNFHIRRLAPIAVDGRFGPNTQRRVIEFQRANRLSDDGVAGPNTNNKLFESEVQQVSISILPAAARGASGIASPTLIPPLSLPGLPSLGGRPLIPVPRLTLLQLSPSSSAPVPAIGNGQVLALSLTVPTRNDPTDPALKSFRQIVNLLETLPASFPFRAALIGAVPNPVKVVGDISSGFRWGIEPVFDLKKLAGPTEFAAGASANASYTINVLPGTGPAAVKLGFFAKGDFKGTIDYTSERATSTPLFQMQGVFTLGFDGRF
jgi:peptidoglycan hydrolase-like protein with peptidoglycan-binding domain